MSDLKFTEDHEWLRMDEDGMVTVGITEYAQEQLGDVVYVELPEIGRRVTPGEDVAVVESVKAAGEVKAGVNGEVVEVNEHLPDSPELVNADAMGEGWFFKLQVDNQAEFKTLMDEDAYQDYISDL